MVIPGSLFKKAQFLQRNLRFRALNSISTVRLPIFVAACCEQAILQGLAARPVRHRRCRRKRTLDGDRQPEITHPRTIY
jgi:hypothetical protein